MNFDFNLPTRLISGFGCIEKHKELLVAGKSAFIVTGRHSAKACGAFYDVTGILDAASVPYTVFSEITENPPLLTCFEGGTLCRESGADFLIAIGGGSVMDAAKAIAAYAGNPQISAEELFSPEKRTGASLPLICIPTTAGTGSEANPYAVMTLPDGEHKKTFTSPDSFARVAFLDPGYTRSLSRKYTISTALDAFAHAVESYLSPKANAVSEQFSLFAAKEIWNVLSQFPDSFDDTMRESLLYASTAAGIAISITGTGFPHPLGYAITLLDGIPHGSACAIFEGDYLEYNEKSPEGKAKLDVFYQALDVKPKVLREYLPALSGVDLTLSEGEILHRLSLVSGAKNYQNSPYVISYDEMLAIYRKHFLK